MFKFIFIITTLKDLNCNRIEIYYNYSTSPTSFILFNSQGGANWYINLVAGGKSGFHALMTGYHCKILSKNLRSYFKKKKRKYDYFSNTV